MAAASEHGVVVDVVEAGLVQVESRQVGVPVVVSESPADHQRVGVEQEGAPAIEADGVLQDLDGFEAQRVDIGRSRVREALDLLSTALTLPLPRHAISVTKPRGRAPSQLWGYGRANIPDVWDGCADWTGAGCS